MTGKSTYAVVQQGDEFLLHYISPIKLATARWNAKRRVAVDQLDGYLFAAFGAFLPRSTFSEVQGIFFIPSYQGNEQKMGFDPECH